MARKSDAGFTLVEILVVLSIISLLAGLSMVGLLRARQDGMVRSEETHVRTLVSMIEAFANELRDYPPSSLRELGVKANTANEGIESLLAHLETRRNNGPFIGDLDLDRRQNTDGDLLGAKDLALVRKKLDWKRAGAELFEYSDHWGNPYVYIHNRDYGKTVEVQTAEGQLLRVQAAKDPAGGYAAPTSFQLRSLGPDGADQNGDGDDICSWKR